MNLLQLILGYSETFRTLGKASADEWLQNCIEEKVLIPHIQACVDAQGNLIDAVGDPFPITYD